MKNYFISIADVSNEEYQIIKMYWDLENGTFLRSSTEIRKMYNLTQIELTSVIASNSSCRVEIGECIDCKQEIIETVYSQTAFKSAMRSKANRCDFCQISYDKKMLEEWEADREREKKQKSDSLEDSVEQENWKKLSPEELHVFMEIVRLKDRKSIFSFTHSNGYKETWQVINKLEKLSLLNVVRDSSRILEFKFSEYFNDLFNKDNGYKNESVIGNNMESFEPLDTYTFNIPLNNSPISGRSPKYSKGFKLDRDVFFEKNVDYIVGAWILDDGSINIAFKPKNSLVKSEDRPLSEDENQDVFENPFNSYKYNPIGNSRFTDENDLE